MGRIAGNRETPTHLVRVGTVTGAAGSSGVFASFPNPFGQSVLVLSTVLEITTQSTGASTLDIGVAADGTTSNDTQIDGLSGAAAGVFNSNKNKGTNGGAAQRWGAAQFLNVAEASGNVDALVATLYAEVAFL